LTSALAAPSRGSAIKLFFLTTGIWLVLAYPAERIMYAARYFTFLSAWTLADRGCLLQAILTPAFLWVVIRPVLRAFGSGTDSGDMKKTRSVAVLLGIVCGLTMAIAWWYLIRNSLGLDQRNREYVHQYFILVSGFNALAAGAIAGELLWRTVRDLPQDIVRRGQLWQSEFKWEAVITWVPLFRISLWVMHAVLPPMGHSWFLYDFFTGDVCLGTLAFCAIPFSNRIWTRVPKDSWDARKHAAKMSFAILGLAMLVNFPLALVGFWTGHIIPYASVLTINFAGFAWAWFIGGRRWEYLQAGSASIPTAVPPSTGT
jgi:hypothetical protein